MSLPACPSKPLLRHLPECEHRLEERWCGASTPTPFIMAIPGAMLGDVDAWVRNCEYLCHAELCPEGWR